MDFSYGGRTHERDGAAGDKDEVAPHSAMIRDMPDQPAGAVPCSSTRKSPLADQLNVLIDELTTAAGYISQLSNHLSVTSSADAEIAYQRAICKLLETLHNISNNKSSTSARNSSIRLCAEGYISRNLSSKNINPASISKDLEIPRSSLYKAFSDSGGVAKYILEKRLDITKSLLINPEEYRSLNQIADALGFDSGAQLSKAFRRRFGYAPRNLRKKPTSSSDVPLSGV